MRNPARYLVEITTVVALTGALIFLSGCSKKNDTAKPATAAELSQMNKDFAKALLAKDAVAASDLKARVFRSDGLIRVDGTLDDPQWALAQPIGEITQREPRTGSLRASARR